MKYWFILLFFSYSLWADTKTALFTFPVRISVSQEGSDALVFNKGIALAISEEKNRADDSLAGDRKLTGKVNKAAETSWQTSEQGCFIELEFSATQQPLQLHAIFRYPEPYQIDEAALIDHLLWHANSFEPHWIATQNTLTPIKQEEGGKRSQSLFIEMYPASKGTLFLSLLNVQFTDPSGTRPPIRIATPLFEIKADESEAAIESLIAPLLALEPQFPLFLSNQNRQLQLEPSKLAAEEKRNLRILHEHAFPWAFLLLLLGIGLAGLAGIKFRLYRLSKQAEATQWLSSKQRAMQTLHYLKSRKSSPRDLYINLSNLCLDYLSDRFNRKTSIFSPEELEPLMKSFDLPSFELKKEMNAFLTRAYYVKFANDQPTEEECKKGLELTEEIISLIYTQTSSRIGFWQRESSRDSTIENDLIL